MSRNSMFVELAEAILGGNLKDLQHLIKMGADLNSCSSDGITALMLSMGRGEPELIAYLIEQGAELNRRNEIGQTALMIAARFGRKDILQQLVRAGAEVKSFDDENRNAVFWALTQEDFPDTISALVEMGADYNTPDIRGMTPLMYSALMGFACSAGILVSVGADESVKSRGKTALEMAAEKGHKDVVENIQAAVKNRSKSPPL